MFKLLLISIVVVPVLVGMRAATASRAGGRGLQVLLVFVLAYDLLYMLMLIYLRFHWIG
jgi:hypothetical protein